MKTALWLILIMYVLILIGMLYGGIHGGDDTVFSGRFIAIDNIPAMVDKPLNISTGSYFIYDVHTDLVYVWMKAGVMTGIFPYYIVDESNTQRIAEYPRDLDYLIYDN